MAIRTGQGRVEHRRRDRQTGRSGSPRSGYRRKALLLGTGSVAVLSILAMSWLTYQGSVLKSELAAATSLLPSLRDQVTENDSPAALATAGKLASHTTAARKAATDPLWIAASAIPWLGANFEAATEVATAADDVAHLGVKPLAGVFESLDWKKIVPTSKGADLKPLLSVEPKIKSAAYAIRTSENRLSAIETDRLLPLVSQPLVSARDDLKTLRIGLDAAADFASLAPSMLGAEQPKKYLLLIQNNSEVRASGGIPGALALLTVDNGQLSLSDQSSAGEMGVFVPPVDTDPEQRQIYSGRLGKFMQDANLTPDFPTAASIARTMWENKTGQRVNGVLSIDPVALGYILDATGPVQVGGAELQALDTGALPLKLTGRNVVRTLLSDVYSQIAEPALQDAYFAIVAKEVFGALASGKGQPESLVPALTRGVETGRILLWSPDGSEQSIISKYPLGGAISGGSVSPAQFGVYFNDGTGAKMDYYVKRTVQILKECTNDGYGQVKVRVTSTNTAPRDAATSLPKYVTGGGAFGVPAGTVQTNVVAYGPVQSNVESAAADGNKIGFASHTHGGRPVGAVTVALPPGKKSTIEFTFGKIVQNTEPELAVTPTVQAREDVVLDTISETCPGFSS